MEALAMLHGKLADNLNRLQKLERQPLEVL
jgi:hypothetical protein